MCIQEKVNNLTRKIRTNGEKMRTLKKQDIGTLEVNPQSQDGDKREFPWIHSELIEQAAWQGAVAVK